MFKALGDESRLKILALLLKHGELCVCDLEHAIDASQSKTSRHLRYLLHAGWVRDRHEGLWSYYRLATGADERLRLLRWSLKKLFTPALTRGLESRMAKHGAAPASTCSPVARKSVPGGRGGRA